MVCEQVRCPGRVSGGSLSPGGSIEDARSFHPSRSASGRLMSACLPLNANAYNRKPHQNDAVKGRAGGENSVDCANGCGPPSPTRRRGGSGTHKGLPVWRAGYGRSLDIVAGVWSSKKERKGRETRCRLNRSFLSPVIAGRRRSLRRMKSATS